MGVFNRESHYRDLLAKQVGGRTEVRLPFGRADVMTDTTVWEVEPASHYPAGVRQALQYAIQSGLRGALAAYGQPAKAEKVFAHLAKLPGPGVDLWWFHDTRFVPVQTAEQARAISTFAETGRWSPEMPQQRCEVIWQDDDEVTHECDERPATWKPMRLCQEHRDQALSGGAPIPVAPQSCCREEPNQCPSHPFTAAQDLKSADELTGAIQRLAWPHLDPDSRDLISSYIIEVRSILWHGALSEPDYPKVWRDDDVVIEGDDEPETILTEGGNA